MSRETRRLLLAGALAVAALWVLARVRFEDRPLTPNPVPAVLSQLAAPPSYDELAEPLEQLHARVEPAVVAFEWPASPATAPAHLAALRWREGVAIAVLAPVEDDGTLDSRIIAHDPVTGLAVVRVPSLEPAVAPATWWPRRERQPRYLFASDVATTGVLLRPVYIAALDAVTSPSWPEPVWEVPASTGLAPGVLVFSSNAEFAGLVVAHEDGVAIVPAETVLAAAARLLETPGRTASTLGIEVQALTPSVAALTGAVRGVVVTWVPPAGDSPSPLQIGDVIDMINGQAILTRQHWDARSALLAPGDRATLRVRRNGESMAVAVTAAPRPPVNRALGLGLRHLPETGVEVTHVDRARAGARAGLRDGDLITRIGAVTAPTPAQLTAAFASLPEGQAVLLAVTRGATHHVLVLGR